MGTEEGALTVVGSVLALPLEGVDEVDRASMARACFSRVTADEGWETLVPLPLPVAVRALLSVVGLDGGTGLIVSPPSVSCLVGLIVFTEDGFEVASRGDISPSVGNGAVGN